MACFLTANTRQWLTCKVSTVSQWLCTYWDVQLRGPTKALVQVTCSQATYVGLWWQGDSMLLSPQQEWGLRPQSVSQSLLACVIAYVQQLLNVWNCLGPSSRSLLLILTPAGVTTGNGVFTVCRGAELLAQHRAQQVQVPLQCLTLVIAIRNCIA